MRNFLVLWTWAEAQERNGRLQGKVKAVGKNAGRLVKGDRTFYVAVHDGKLHLLGAIEVERSGADWLRGESPGGFKIIPLNAHAWKLRFDSPVSTRLSPKSLHWQLRMRRRLTVESSELLEKILSR